jgi:hypothetical protein
LLVGKVSLGGTMEQPKEFPLRTLGRSSGKQYGQIRLARRDGKRKAGSAEAKEAGITFVTTHLLFAFYA